MPARGILEDIKLRTGQDFKLPQSKEVPIKEYFKTPYTKSQSFIHANEEALRQETPKTQPATEVLASPKLEQPETLMKIPSLSPYQSLPISAAQPLIEVLDLSVRSFWVCLSVPLCLPLLSPKGAKC